MNIAADYLHAAMLPLYPGPFLFCRVHVYVSKRASLALVKLPGSHMLVALTSFANGLANGVVHGNEFTAHLQCTLG
jgi:type IV secretory pathway TrbL component